MKQFDIDRIEDEGAIFPRRPENKFSFWSCFLGIFLGSMIILAVFQLKDLKELKRAKEQPIKEAKTSQEEKLSSEEKTTPSINQPIGSKKLW